MGSFVHTILCQSHVWVYDSLYFRTCCPCASFCFVFILDPTDFLHCLSGLKTSADKSICYWDEPLKIVHSSLFFGVSCELCSREELVDHEFALAISFSRPQLSFYSRHLDR